jgi:CheY-like chemotaxis protein
VAALEELGYRPFACGSGKEAMDILAARETFDLIITDIMMPEMTGPELVRLIAPQHPSMGVIFVTGYVGDAGDAEELSGYDMLRKPFTVTALAQAVARTLARKFSGLPPEPTSEAAE